MKKSITPGRVWTVVFAFWGLFLSGVVANFIGSPGIIQSLRLASLLQSKQQLVVQMQGDVKRLQLESVQLEKSKVVQQREIRRVLGYATSDEIIFDFAGSDTI
jgi:hypothetical protein